MSVRSSRPASRHEPSGKDLRHGCLALLACIALSAATAFAAEDVVESAPSKANAEGQRLFDAIVKIETRAMPGARSSASLGEQREGTGIVIGPDGLVLTIGYLIIEAAEINVIDHRGRKSPATVVGYDHPTGLGLVRTLVPGDYRPVALGESGTLRERDPVMVVNHTGRGDVTLAFVVSRRPFTGSWEYALEEAIFTAPPTFDWSGAALIGKDGRLLGVGSLVVRDAVEGETPVPGNMFVPIDVLKPVLADLVKSGHRAGPARPWLGVSADEVQGRLFVSRVPPGGPADRAGLRAGDIILGVGKEGVRSQAEFYRKVWSMGAAGTEIPLRVLHDIDVRDVQVRSIDRVEYFAAPATP